MLSFEFFISIISLIFQFVVTIYGFKLYKSASYLNTWKLGWSHFIGASIMILLLRVIWSWEFYFNIKAPQYLESILALIVSACLFWFISYMKISFKYSLINKDEESKRLIILTSEAEEIKRLALNTAKNLKELAIIEAEDIKKLAVDIAKKLKEEARIEAENIKKLAIKEAEEIIKKQK